MSARESALVWRRRAVRVLQRRAARGIVLLYHRIAGPRFDPLLLDVSAAHFGAQLAVLRERFAPLPLEEFEARRRRGALPRRAVTVTFDDGYADNLLAAAPLLERHGVPATVFVTSGMVGARHEFWWDEVERIAFSPRTLEPPVPWVPMSWRDADGAPVPRPGPGWLIGASETPTSRHRLFRSLIGALRPLSAPERRRRLEVLRSWAGVSEAARDSHRALSADELRALARRPGITVGSHTVTHPQLSAQPPAAQRAELTESRRALQAALERPVRAVAYPFGTRLDVSTTSRRAARDAGYDVAFSTEAGVAWRWSDRAWMPRCVVLDWEADEFTERLERWLG